MRIRQQEVEQRRCPCPLGSKYNHLRCPVKRRDKDRCRNKDNNANDLRQNHGTGNTESCTLFRALIILRSQILTDKCGKRHCEAGDRQESEPLDFGVCSASCHGHFAKGIDIGLYYNICNGDDGILKSGWKTELNHLFKDIPFKPDFPQVQTVFRFGPHQLDHTEYSADHLRNIGSKGSSAHSHIKYRNKHNIQNYINYG